MPSSDDEAKRMALTLVEFTALIHELIRYAPPDLLLKTNTIMKRAIERHDMLKGEPTH
jgi:hypothetical protein